MTYRLKMPRFSAAAAVVLAAACGSGMLDIGYPTGVSGGGGGSSVGSAAAYDGIVADSTHHGRINMSVNAQQLVSGTLSLVGGSTVALTGTVDTVAQVLHASGGGYTIIGQPYHGTIQGVYTGPAGTSTGYLIASSDSLTQLTHTSYCGTYTSTNGTGWIGMLILSDDEVGGFSVQTVGHAASQSFTGSIANGATIIATTNLSAVINATLTSGTITGTYSPPIGSTPGTGSFTATSGGC